MHTKTISVKGRYNHQRVVAALARAFDLDRSIFKGKNEIVIEGENAIVRVEQVLANASIITAEPIDEQLAAMQTRVRKMRDQLQAITKVQHRANDSVPVRFWK